jgi:hypothetical protein
MKSKTKNKYLVVGDDCDYPVNGDLYTTLKEAEKYAKELIQDGSNETVEVFELVSVKKFKMAAVEVKD